MIDAQYTILKERRVEIIEGNDRKAMRFRQSEIAELQTLFYYASTTMLSLFDASLREQVAQLSHFLRICNKVWGLTVFSPDPFRREHIPRTESKLIPWSLRRCCSSPTGMNRDTLPFSHPLIPHSYSPWDC